MKPTKIAKQNLLSKISLLIISFYFIFSYPAFSATISGKISISGKYASKAKLKDVVVYFEPENEIVASPLAESHKVLMKNKAYHPRVSVISAGSILEVTNKDSILHNAFSPSRSNQFDLGLYGKNKSRDYLLKKEGVVRIFCNVHYHMVAYVLVLKTPFYTLTNEHGEYRLDGLPEGNGKLVFWHERANRVVKTLNISTLKNESQSKKLNVDIPITKRRIPTHKNKSGKSYKKKRRKRRY